MQTAFVEGIVISTPLCKATSDTYPELITCVSLFLGSSVSLVYFCILELLLPCLNYYNLKMILSISWKTLSSFYQSPWLFMSLPTSILILDSVCRVSPKIWGGIGLKLYKLV